MARRLRFQRLDRVQRDRLMAGIKAGESITALAEAFGVSRRTVYNYKARLEETELQYRSAVLTVRLNKPDLAGLDELAELVHRIGQGDAAAGVERADERGSADGEREELGQRQAEEDAAAGEAGELHRHEFARGGPVVVRAAHRLLLRWAWRGRRRLLRWR